MVKQIWKKYRLISLSIIILIFFNSPAGIKTLAAGPTPPPFGYQALKIDGKFVRPEIFSDEQNQFFLRWHTNATMVHKTVEERNDLLLEDIINRVAVDEYLDNFVTVTPKEVNDYINRYIKARYVTPGAMADYMVDMNYQNESEMRKGVELYLKKLKCFPPIARQYGIAIPAAELEGQYRQQVADNRKALIRQILITDPDLQKAARQAEVIYNKLKNGADFAKIAAQYSADLGTRTKGGLIEPFEKGFRKTEFNTKVFNANEGDLIAPFQIPSGYIIIRVEKFIGFYHPKEEFATMMLVEKFGNSEQLKKWAKQVQSKLTIEILDPAFKAYRIFRSGQYDQAGVLYEKAYAVYHGENYLTRAGESYQMAKTWEHLIKLGQSGMNKFPGKVQYYLDTAEGLYRSGQVKPAMELMRKAEIVAGDNTYNNGMVMRTYSKLGLEKDANRVKPKAGILK